MTVVLVFGLVLLLTVLLSAVAERTVLSTAAVVLIAGYVSGPGALGLVSIPATHPVVAGFAELALFSILFTDGLRLGTSSLRSSWQLPVRALAIGLPLTFAITGCLAHWIAGCGWSDAWLVAAALAPTDPVFASALIARNAVPEPLRHLLNVESGFNDGLALPIVISLLAIRGAASVSLGRAILQVVLGLAIGVGIAWGAVLLRRISVFEVSRQYAPLGVFAIGVIVLAISTIAGANEFLAAFAGGITLAVKLPRARDAFEPFGEPLSEVLKLAALLLFGAILSPELPTALNARVLLFGVLALIVARPAALMLSLLGSDLGRRETLAAAWFGPRGFASVFFALMILQSGVADAAATFRLLATTIALSMIAHASTDVLVARWLAGAEHERVAPSL